MSHRHLEGACEKLSAPKSSSGPGSPGGDLWALQHVEKEDNIPLLLRKHREKLLRHYHATPVT